MELLLGHGFRDLSDEELGFRPQLLLWYLRDREHLRLNSQRLAGYDLQGLGENEQTWRQSGRSGGPVTFAMDSLGWSCWGCWASGAIAVCMSISGQSESDERERACT